MVLYYVGICLLASLLVGVSALDGSSEGFDPASFPFVARIRIGSYENVTYCTATILSQSHVITAGHCLRSLGEAGDDTDVPVDQIKVEWDGNQVADALEVTFPSQYNSFWPPEELEDVAIVQVSLFTFQVRAAELGEPASSNYLYGWHAGSQLQRINETFTEGSSCGPQLPLVAACVQSSDAGSSVAPEDAGSPLLNGAGDLLAVLSAPSEPYAQVTLGSAVSGWIRSTLGTKDRIHAAYISPDGDDAANCTAAFPCATLFKAQQLDNEQIAVLPGVYTVARGVVFTRDVTIQPTAAGVVFDCTGIENPFITLSNASMWLFATEIRIKNGAAISAGPDSDIGFLKVSVVGQSPAIDGLVTDRANYVQLSECSFSDTNINIRAQHLALIDTTSTNCWAAIESNDANILRSTSYHSDMSLNVTEDATFSECNFTVGHLTVHLASPKAVLDCDDLDFTDVDAVALSVTGDSGAVFVGQSTFTNCATAVQVMGGKDDVQVKIEKITVSDTSGETSLLLRSVKQASVLGSTFANSNEYHLVAYGSVVDVSGCSFKGAARSALAVEGGAAVTISETVITRNGGVVAEGGAIVCLDETSPLIEMLEGAIIDSNSRDSGGFEIDCARCNIKADEKTIFCPAVSFPLFVDAVRGEDDSTFCGGHLMPCLSLARISRIATSLPKAISVGATSEEDGGHYYRPSAQASFDVDTTIICGDVEPCVFELDQLSVQDALINTNASLVLRNLKFQFHNAAKNYTGASDALIVANKPHSFVLRNVQFVMINRPVVLVVPSTDKFSARFEDVSIGSSTFVTQEGSAALISVRSAEGDSPSNGFVVFSRLKLTWNTAWNCIVVDGVASAIFADFSAQDNTCESSGVHLNHISDQAELRGLDFTSNAASIELERDVASATISNSAFLLSSAPVLSAKNAQLYVDHTEFSDTHDIGAVWLDLVSAHHSTFAACIFSGNGGANTVHGGALDISTGPESSGSVSIARCFFDGNRAVAGAHVSISNSGAALGGVQLELRNSSFIDGEATRYGGALNVRGARVWIDSRVIFSGNRAAASRDAQALLCVGGSISIEAPSSLSNLDANCRGEPGVPQGAPCEYPQFSPCPVDSAPTAAPPTGPASPDLPVWAIVLIALGCATFAVVLVAVLIMLRRRRPATKYVALVSEIDSNDSFLDEGSDPNKQSI